MTHPKPGLTEPIEYWRFGTAEAANLRWLAGVERYRAGNAVRPFVGDALVEAHEEAIDLINYLAVAHREGRLTDPQWHDLARMAVAIAERIRVELLMEEAEANR